MFPRYDSPVDILFNRQQALLFDPKGLDALVPSLLEGLQGDGPLVQDDARLGDTADLLGQIGHPDARPLLQTLAGHENEEVVEAAELALEEMDERAEVREE